MILENKKTTIAYRCPACGSGVMSAVDIFRLSADMVKLKCTCKHSEMTAVQTGDGKVRLTVPCIVCPEPHHFLVNKSLFFGKELFLLPCPYTDINICFMGEENHVKAELARTELELLDMLEESGIDDFSALHGDEQTLPDPQVRDIVLFVVRDMDAEGKIYCHCPPRQKNENGETDPDESRIEAEVTPDGILVRCTVCGASRLIPADSMLSAHAFLNADALYLE